MIKSFWSWWWWWWCLKLMNGSFPNKGMPYQWLYLIWVVNFSDWRHLALFMPVCRFSFHYFFRAQTWIVQIVALYIIACTNSISGARLLWFGLWSTSVSAWAASRLPGTEISRELWLQYLAMKFWFFVVESSGWFNLWQENLQHAYVWWKLGSPVVIRDKLVFGNACIRTCDASV